MTIDYGKIVTNALSALVATIFVGAAAIVWTAATTIDGKIDAAQADITASVETLVEEVAELKANIKSLEEQGARLARAANRPATLARPVPEYTQNQRLRIQQDIRAKKEQAK